MVLDLASDRDGDGPGERGSCCRAGDTDTRRGQGQGGNHKENDNAMMGMGMVSTDAFRFGNHLRLCWLPGQERQPMDSFNTSPPGDIGNCHADCDADSDGDDDSDEDFI